MGTRAAPARTNSSSAAEAREKGHIGLVVLAAIALGLLLGLLFVVVVFAGGPEQEMTGTALIALGAGFVLLAVGSSRFTDQAQALKSLGGRPVAVVTALSGAMRGWVAAQSTLATLSTNSVHRTVPDATHETLLEDERFAKIASHSIVQVVRSARSGLR